MKRPCRIFRALACLFVMLACLCAAAMAEGLSPMPWDLRVSPIAPHEECFLPDDAGYHDDSLDISVETYRVYDTTVMAVRVKLSDISQFRTALAAPYPSTSVGPVSSMAKRAKAVLAVNGDFFMYDDPHRKVGIVMRNGELYREKPKASIDTLIVDKNGDFTILSPTTAEAWAPYAEDALHVFTFGPGLVINGQVLEDDERVDQDLGKRRKTQRIAICQMGPLDYLFIATEGPENKGSEGVTLLEMAQICAATGCQNAYNLDGGSSSTIVLNNKKINSRSSGKVRPVGDCIWFATIVP